MSKRQSEKPSPQISEKKLEIQLRQPPVEQTPEPLPARRIKKDASRRAKKSRPLISKIVNAINRDTSPFREIIINSEPLETRVAVLEDGVIKRFEVERVGEDRLVGAVFKGKIQNLEPGPKSCICRYRPT